MLEFDTVYFQRQPKYIKKLIERRSHSIIKHSISTILSHSQSERSP
ncbi:hypothetical protein [Nostoc sp.]